MARLRVLSGPLEIDLFELGATNTTIGRAKKNIFRFEHRSVSKYHALIVSDDDGELLFDLDSTNGTFLNNQRISSAPLKHGDHIRLGEFVVAYETADVPEAAPVPQPTAHDTTIEPAKPALRLRNEAPLGAPPPAPPPAPRPVLAPRPLAPAPQPQPVVAAANESRPAPAPTAPPPAKATGSQGKAFIRLPTDKNAPQEKRKSGLMDRVLGREKTDEPAATPAAPPAPVALPRPPAQAPGATITAQLPRTLAAAPRPAPPPPQPEPEPAAQQVEPPPPAHQPEPAPPAPPPAAPPEPSAPATPAADKSLNAQPQPSGEQVIQRPAAGDGGQTGERILRKPGAQAPSDTVLLRPPAKKSDEIVLKKPGAGK